MKKILIISVIAVLLVATLSFVFFPSNLMESAKLDREDAIQINNTIQEEGIERIYHAKNKTAVVRNQSTKDILSQFSLKTPHNNTVQIGYRKVAEIEVNPKVNYNSLIKRIELYDAKNNYDEIDREIDLKYKTTENYEVVKEICDNSTGQCSTSTETKTRTKWKDFDNSVDVGESLTLGLFTQVKKDDYVEWIPQIAGVRVPEWALWTGSDAPAVYYALNDTSGDVKDSTGNGNVGTNNGATRGVGGIIDNAFSFDGVNDWVNITALPETGITWSVQLWFNTNSTTGTQYMLDSRASGQNNGTIIQFTSDFIRISVNGVNFNAVNRSNATDGKWHQIVVTGNNTEAISYFDGQQTNSTTISQTALGGYDSVLGAIRTSGGAQEYNGSLDEVGFWNRTLNSSEVSDLYNDGDACAFGDETCGKEVLVTLETPLNDTSTNNNTLTFNSTIEVSSFNLTNATLYIWRDNGTLFYNETIIYPGGTTSDTNATFFNVGNFDVDKYDWNVEARLSDFEDTRSIQNFTFTWDNVEPIVNIDFPTGDIFHESGANLTLNFSILDFQLDSCWYNWNGTNVTIANCSANTTNIQNVNDFSNTNVTLYANDTAGNQNSTTSSWDYTAFQTNITFNETVFETENSKFTINFSTLTTPTSAELIYEGTKKSASIKNLGNNNFSASAEKVIPVGGANNTFFFNITGNNEVSSNNNNQTVNEINLTICGSAPQNVQFINFTFKNETVDQESVNASITTSTWKYSLSALSKGVNKTLTYSNSTENPSYQFCFSPSNRTVNTDLTLKYDNSESQQRQLSLITSLNNVTTDKILYLLPTSLGLFSSFTTIDVAGNSIAKVRAEITRTLGGSNVDITSGFTDDSGFITFFLNPNIDYSAEFSKSGFQTESFSFIPSSDTRIVTLSRGSGTIGEGTKITRNTSYIITPENNTLANDTIYSFGFNVTSNQTITFISLNITNSTGYSFLSLNNSGQGSISGNLNTLENESFIGYYVIKTSNETLSITKKWTIGRLFIGDYSIFKQFDLFEDYGFNNFIQMLIVLVSIIGMILFMSGQQALDNQESKIAVALAMIWAFSIVGWLDTGLVVNSSTSGIQTLGQYSNQYGVAIISSAIGGYFLIRRVFT